VDAGIVANQRIVITRDPSARKTNRTRVRTGHNHASVALGNGAYQHFRILLPNLSPRLELWNLFALVFLNRFDECDDGGKIGRLECFDPDHDSVISPILRPPIDLHGDAHKLGKILRADALHNPGAVVFYGFRADIELRSDFLVRQPGDGKFHHLPLSRR